MVGDNPTSDMEGVRRANIHHMGSTTQWRGVLVRTGVYKEGDETNGAHVVFCIPDACAVCVNDTDVEFVVAVTRCDVNFGTDTFDVVVACTNSDGLGL